MVFKRRDKLHFLVRLRDAFFPRRGWRRVLEYIGHRVKRLPDTPHRIALGVSCGVFASFTPLFGLHFFLAAGLAWVVRGNIIASLIGTFAGNPLTLPLIASIAMGLGRRILGYGVTGRDFGRVTDAFAQGFAGLWHSLLSLFGWGEPEWDRLAVFFSDVVLPYLVGGLLPGLVAAIASYYLARPLIGAYQSRRRARMVSRSLARERLAAEKSKADGVP